MRIAAPASRGGTPIAVSTCDGVDASALTRRAGGAGDAAQVERHEHRLAVGARAPRCSGCAARAARRVRESPRRERARGSPPRAGRAARASRAHSSSRSATASSAARASPTAAATFSVPGRRPRSCEPPCSSGSIGVPRRMNIAPMPFGAPILWPEIESRSNGVVRASIVDLAERLHGVGVEQRRRAPSRARASCRDRLHRADLVVHPHHRADRDVVVARARRTTRRRRRRRASSRQRRSSAPSCAAWCTAPSTALCSIGVVTTALRPSPRRARQAPRMARLSRLGAAGGEADLVGDARRDIGATRSRASSSAVRASRPQRCMLDGLPKRGPKNGCIASSTSARTGVVAAWSR